MAQPTHCARAIERERKRCGWDLDGIRTLLSKSTWSKVAWTKTALTQPLTTFIWTAEHIEGRRVSECRHSLHQIDNGVHDPKRFVTQEVVPVLGENMHCFEHRLPSHSGMKQRPQRGPGSARRGLIVPCSSCRESVLPVGKKTRKFKVRRRIQVERGPVFFSDSGTGNTTFPLD